jgi:tetratricopeptide (TPR) repeat protein
MSRTYVDLWGWFDQFYHQAVATRDEERKHLCNIRSTAFNQREKEPQRALSMYREAVALAERLNEPWMALFHEYRIAEMLVFYLARYEEGLELATKLVTRSSQEAFLNCPVRPRVFITLIAAYYEVDALSYVDEIRAMLHTMEHQMPLDEDTYQRLFFFKAGLWLWLGEYDQAFIDAQKYIEVSIDSPFRSAGAYGLLCQICYIQGHTQQALEYAYLCQEAALKDGSSQAQLAGSHLWHAILMARLAQTAEAEKRFALGTAHAKAFNVSNMHVVLRGTSRYYETIGAYEKSLAVWNGQIQRMSSQAPNRQSHFYVFLRRCFVLRRMGCLTETDIDQARQIALGMRKPEKYLALLDELNDGQIDIPRY